MLWSVRVWLAATSSQHWQLDWQHCGSAALTAVVLEYHCQPESLTVCTLSLYLSTLRELLERDDLLVCMKYSLLESWYSLLEAFTRANFAVLRL